MKKFLFALTIATIAFLIPQQAFAVLVVDTGQPPDTGGYYLASYQSLAGMFTLDQAYTLTGIEGYLYPYLSYTLPATLTLTIYGDNSGSVDDSTELFSSPFSLTSGGYQWGGVSGMDLDLGPGTYWAAFEVRDGQTFDGYMPKPAPNPLDLYAVSYDNNNYVWTSFEGLHQFGLRINAEGGGVVPEPATMSLLGLGLFGFAGLKRKQKKV